MKKRKITIEISNDQMKVVKNYGKARDIDVSFTDPDYLGEMIGEEVARVKKKLNNKSKKLLANANGEFSEFPDEDYDLVIKRKPKYTGGKTYSELKKNEDTLVNKDLFVETSNCNVKEQAEMMYNRKMAEFNRFRKEKTTLYKNDNVKSSVLDELRSELKEKPTEFTRMVMDEISQNY